MNLKDVVAVVTGGASGIGETVATYFASNGAKVVIGDVVQGEHRPRGRRHQGCGRKRGGV